MADLIRIARMEWIKVKSHKTFWFFVVSYMLMLGFLIYTSARFRFGPINADGFEAPNLMELLGQGNTWLFLTWTGKWGFYLLGLLVIHLLAAEWDQRTFRQMVISGLSRLQLLLGRYVLVAALIFLCVIYTAVLALLFAGTEAVTHLFPQGWTYLVAFVVQGTMTLSWATLLALVLRKAVVTTVVFLLWPIVIEPIVGWYLDSFVGTELSQWLPFQSVTTALPSPFGALMAPGGMAEPALVQWSMVGLGTVYIVAMIAAAAFRIKTVDL